MFPAAALHQRPVSPWQQHNPEHDGNSLSGGQVDSLQPSLPPGYVCKLPPRPLPEKGRSRVTAKLRPRPLEAYVPERTAESEGL